MPVLWWQLVIPAEAHGRSGHSNPGFFKRGTLEELCQLFPDNSDFRAPVLSERPGVSMLLGAVYLVLPEIAFKLVE